MQKCYTGKLPPTRLHSVLMTPLVELILNSGSGFHFTCILFSCFGVKGLQVSTAYSFVFGSRREKNLSRLNNKEFSQCDVSVAFILVFC